MDSDALNTFLVVHRRGGISNAAKALHRSQPAISRRIALLEQELGVPLFERIGGKTRLSDAGRVMVPYAERAVAAAQAHYAAAGLPAIGWFQEALAAQGYRVPRHGHLDDETRNVIAAFQMKYRPADIGGEPDAETAARLLVLNLQAAG